MDKELINDIIEYIESSEEEAYWQRGNCGSLEDLIKNGEMPEIYDKLIKLKL